MKKRISLPKKALPWILLQIISITSVTLLSRRILQKNISPLALAGSIQLISGSIVLLKTILSHQKIFGIRKNILQKILIVSIVGTALSYGFGFAGLSLSGAINYTFLLRSSIFFVPLLARLFLAEKLSPSKIILMFLFFTGIFLLVTKGKGIYPQKGDLLILLGTLCFSIGVILSKKILDHIHPEVFAVYRPLFAGSFLILLSFFFDPPDTRLLNPTILLIGALLSLANLGYSHALAYASASYLVLMNVLVPVFTTLPALFILHESLHIMQIPGIILILLSAVLVQGLEIRESGN